METNHFADWDIRHAGDSIRLAWAAAFLMGNALAARWNLHTRSNGNAFAGFLVVNDVLARLQLRQRFNPLPCSLEGLHGFHEMEFTAVEQVAEHSQDAIMGTHAPNSVLTRDHGE